MHILTSTTLFGIAFGPHDLGFSRVLEKTYDGVFEVRWQFIEQSKHSFRTRKTEPRP